MCCSGKECVQVQSVAFRPIFRATGLLENSAQGHGCSMKSGNQSDVLYPHRVVLS